MIMYAGTTRTSGKIDILNYMARSKQKAKGFPYPHRVQPKVVDVLVFTATEIYQKSPHVCAICEEGGDLIICDGPCHR